VAWQSLDATTFTQPDTPPSAFAQPWVDVALIVPASGSAAPATYRLRPNGFADLFQGSLVGSYDSSINFLAADPAFSWQEARGISFIGISGYGLVCGRNGSADGALPGTSHASPGWVTTPMPAAQAPPHRLSMLSEVTGYACGNSGSVVNIVPDPGGTIPLGQYWDTLANNPGIAQNLNGIQFLDKDLGWVVGDAGKIYRIRNASTTPAWDVQTSNTAENLYD